MNAAGTRARVLPGALATLLVACMPARYRPPDFDRSYRPPVGIRSIEPDSNEGDPQGPGQPSRPDQARRADQQPEPAMAPTGPLQLDRVLDSVTSRYPPMLSALLERDLASGRVQQAMGAFDTNLSAKVGGQVQGFYESTLAQGLIEQPLASGDTIYGGYRISDGFLPDYDKDRTQDDGEWLFGGRFPLLRNRGFDSRRAGLRKAEIDFELADPNIARARIEFIRSASKAYFTWVAAGRRLAIARELLRLATDREDALARAVERQFLAPIVVIDNERLVAQRQVFVARATRDFQQAALELSLFLRGADDRPIVAGEPSLPEAGEQLPPPDDTTLDDDLKTAMQQRPDLRQLQLQLERAETDRDLADNQMLPSLDVVVEAQSSLNNSPYKDRNDLELFVGGELKLPLQLRAARGQLAAATATISRLQLQMGFARERIVNSVVDARSALVATREQLATTRRNVDLAQQLVAFEQRSFELGRSDLLRIQLREVQLADAQALAIDAQRAWQSAGADYRAALGR